VNAALYQLFALGARYLFIFLAFLIVCGAAMWLLHEHSVRRKILKNLPDAGLVGEMRDIDSGKAYPLPREGVLGSGRNADIRVRGLRRRAVSFAFVEGKGVLLTPLHRRSGVMLDEEPFKRGVYALHNAILACGGHRFKIRLFAGLNVPHPAAFADHWQAAQEEELYAPDNALEGYPVYDPVYAETASIPPVMNTQYAPPPQYTQPQPVQYPQGGPAVPYVQSADPVQYRQYVPVAPMHPVQYTMPESAENEIPPAMSGDEYSDIVAQSSPPVLDTPYPEQPQRQEPSAPAVRRRRSDRWNQ